MLHILPMTQLARPNECEISMDGEMLCVGVVRLTRRSVIAMRVSGWVSDSLGAKSRVCRYVGYSSFGLRKILQAIGLA
jgi:hypothetical protein